MVCVIDWNSLEVENEKLALELVHILQQWDLTLRGRTI